MLFNFHPHYFARDHIDDFSSYLLFEASGDSEVDLGGSTATLNLVEFNDAKSCTKVEFNDAESCTDDTPDLYDEFVRDENESEAEEDDEEEYKETFENDGVVESKAIGFTTSSSASIDSTKDFKMLNDVEKNRLFWETCLAS
ncbi:uncharacterized protein LOC111497906 isoform X1 [Cucurbita maxima]|uniref:Uncharacterized protein LOC111497906 isoform X1 n=1 Tax=Cucurbita maxima TaxID=3661 RepID=A0A6J1KX07_CUCMA|nr:uncharacterized protein LOC111497906 isoform X1 [Cucurbita maxima]